MRNRLFVAAALVAAAAGSSHAAVFATQNTSNAIHYGYYGFASTSANNSRANLGPHTNKVAKRILIEGTVTKVHEDAWLSSIQVQPSGNNLAVYQPWIEFSDQRDFQGTVSVKTTVYIPGGLDMNQQLKLEFFSLDSEQFVPGIDARSSLSWKFDDAFAPGTAEYSGELKTSDPKFNRPAQYYYTNGLGQIIWRAPELTGAFPYYDAQPFHVDTAGTYEMMSANEFESSSVLYAGSFNPANSLANVVAARNQSGNILRTKGSLNDLPYLDDAVGATSITASLVPGVQYYYVTTAFNAPGIEPDGGPFIGRYKNLITGPGNVTLGIVPEPASALVLMAIAPGLGRHRTKRG